MASAPLRLAKPRHSTPPSFTWDAVVVLWVEKLIRKCWKKVRLHIDAKKPVQETKLNTLLRREIVKELERQVARGNHPYLALVTSSEEVPDYAGSLIENKPDLVIRVNGYKEQWNALFIECKVLSKSATVSSYGREGIARFVAGKYAWTMTHAMMLGYCVRPDSVAAVARPVLASYISRSKLKRSHIKTGACDLGGKSQRDLVVTEHKREFTLGRHTFKPIKIRHMWLQAR